MAWYLVCFCVGIIAGLIIEDRISTDITIKGKVKQKGENNRLFFSNNLSNAIESRKEKRLKKRTERREKRRLKKEGV